MKSYPAIYHKEDNCYWAEFPDLQGCYVQGNTLEEVKKMANETLSAYLESLDSRKISINKPSEIHGKNIFYVDVNLKTAFAITLKVERKKQGLTQKQVAEKMGVNWTMYQRIENPRKCNPTLSTIEKLSEVFGKQFLNLSM